MAYIIEAACTSCTGLVRQNNEDNFSFFGTVKPKEAPRQDPPLTVRLRSGDAAVAAFDGMGGCDFGEEASFAAALAFGGALTEYAHLHDPVDFLEQVTFRANRSVFDLRQTLRCGTSGSTMAAMLFREEDAWVCNLGDSRIYRMRSGTLEQLSVDHTSPGRPGKRSHRLYQYLGMDPGDILIEPHIAPTDILPGDLYLICSDGLTDMVPDEAIGSILRSGSDLAPTVLALQDAALEQGGKDNITVILCRVSETESHWRKENEPAEHNHVPLEGLGDPGTARGRQLWNRVQNAAQAAWRRYRGSGR